MAILPKIRQVDELLRNSESARKVVREVHPEVCFWGLNGKKSMKYSKRKSEGFNERLKVIKKINARCDELVNETLKHKGFGVSRDDILDALCAAVTAKYGFNELKTLPEAPEHDIFGLPMEMVYYRPDMR